MQLHKGIFYIVASLKTDQLKFPSCNVRGRISGKKAEMVVDYGCTRNLVHKRYVSDASLTGEKISLLTAAGERLVIPLAWVEIESEQGKYKEVVGVFDRLPVDCLLGRLSFGQTLCKENILDQWENNILAHDRENNED